MKVVRYFSIFLLIINVVFLRLIYLNLSKSLDETPPTIEKTGELSTVHLELSKVEPHFLEPSSDKRNVSREPVANY